MNKIQVLADALIGARTSGTEVTVSSLPELTDMQEAMEVQALVAAHFGGKVAGWKIGLRPDEVVSTPLLQNFMVPSGGSFAWTPGHYAGFEVEIAFRLSKDLPPRSGSPYTMDEIRDAIGTVLVGIEIVQSRIANFLKAAPFVLIASDNIASGIYVAGDETLDWQKLDLSKLNCRLFKNGVVIHDAMGGHGNGDPMSPLLAYANAQSSKVGWLKAGQIVTTGSVCGMLPIDGASLYHATVEGLGEVELRVTT